MTTQEVKEYLRDIKYYRQRLERLKKRRKDIHLEVSFGSVNISGDRVTSTPENKMEKALIRLSERIELIDKDIALMSIEVDDRLKKIESLDKNNHKEVLFKRYSEYKSFEQIACDMNYSYNYVCSLHGEALKELRHKIKSEKTS